MIEGSAGRRATGDVPAAVADGAWARVHASVAGLPVEELRVRMSQAGQISGLVLGQVAALAAGRRVRVQAAGLDYGSAIDALCRRLRVRVAYAAAGFPPRPWPENDGAPHPPGAPRDPRGAGHLVRVKRCVLVWSEIDAAAATLDAMDYQAHLFTDPDTGADAVIYRAGPTGYRVTRLAPGAPPRPVRVPLVLDVQPVSVLTREQALARLDQGELPHLFFDERESGRGSLLYRRFDGHYALVRGV